MKVIIDIGHPAHVHYFKNLISNLMSEGDSVKVFARNKEMTHMLLKEYGIKFINRGKGKNSILGKLLYLIKVDWLILKMSISFKPDIFLGFGSPYAAQVAFLMKKPSIILDDTENAKFGQLFYKFFASSILSPSCFFANFGRKHLKFSSYMELSYLHPNLFQIDESILNDYRLSINEKYTVIRFVSWNANHDYGHKGLSIQNKILAVKSFSKFGKVLITSEKELPPELEQYKLKINPIHIHQILAGASLFYGESATMASESAVLGTPAVYLDNVGRGYTSEQEINYKLVFNFTESENDQKSSIEKGIEILKTDKNIFIERQKKMMKDKIDLTSFLTWFLKNYPQSAKTIKDNPEFQYNFK